MTVPKEILKKWESLRDSGDVLKLMDLAEKTQPIISRALNDGECTQDVFKVIAKFYNERQEIVNSAL